MPSGSSRAQTIAHLDDDHVATGTHDGEDGTLTLRNMKASFKSCNIGVGVVVENDTDGSAGVTVSISEQEILCTLSGGTNNTWTKGDTYYIYATDTKGSIISTISVDRRFGRKVVKGDVLDANGILPADADLDENDENVFGPGQPSHSHD